MIAYRCGALLSFLLGLFAKETMIVVPVLALLLDCSSEGTDSLRPHLKQKWKWYAGFLLCFALYLSIRIGQGFPLTMEDSARPGLDPISRLLVAPKLIALYLGIMAYPAELHVFRKVDLPQSPFDWQIGPGILLLAFILASAKLCWEKQKHISVGILWFVIAISPVLGLLRLNADVMEHWLYLPSIGLALAFVGSIKLLAEHVGERRGAAIALVLIALLFSARTVTRNAEWGSLVQIFSQNVTAYPTHPSAWVWLGDALKNQGRWNEAVKAYEAALALDFSHPALVGLADALLVVGKGIEGEVLLTKAASASPDDPWLLYILGFHRLKLGKDTAAIEALEKNISLEPSVSAYHLLGSAYLRIAAQEKAERAFEKALALEPEKPGLHASIHLRLGNLYRALGRSREARDEQRIALRFAPDLDQAKALLAE
jgi:tetratricopeptide (TPR) repeat protein